MSLPDELIFGQGQEVVIQQKRELGPRIEHELPGPAIDGTIDQNVAIEQVKGQREIKQTNPVTVGREGRRLSTPGVRHGLIGGTRTP